VAEIDAVQGEEDIAEVARSVCDRRRGDVGGLRGGEESPGGGELGVDVSGGEQAMMADLDEALGEDVQHEAPEKLVDVEGDARLASRAEGDVASVEGDESLIAEADTVGVLVEVGEDPRVVAEGRLAVDDPPEALELVAETAESLAVLEGRGGPVEAELSVVVGASEGIEDFSAEQLAEGAHRKEVVDRGGHDDDR
jgi:hypothetical protein